MKQSNTMSRPCPKCSTGKLYTGRNSWLNAHDERGLQICNDCKVKEVYASVLERRD